MRTKPMSGDYSVGVQALQDSGYKLTGPRLTILQLLEESGGPITTSLRPPPLFRRDPPPPGALVSPAPPPPAKNGVSSGLGSPFASVYSFTFSSRQSSY